MTSQQNASDEALMAAALEQGRLALLAGEPPIGAVVVLNGQVVAEHNAVVAELDPTAHAEIRVIRRAARAWRQLDLSGARLFVTVEPCPMCIAACHYAGIKQVLFGAGLEDMHAITGAELVVDETAALAMELTGGLRRAECLDLLRAWGARRVS